MGREHEKKVEDNVRRDDPADAGGLFGRAPAGPVFGHLTDVGCPDCRGVLAVRELGKKHWLAFECRVGHSFSGDSLLMSKEDQLESSLWATVEVLEEVVLLHRELAGRARAAGGAALADAYEQRAHRAAAHVQTVRGILAIDAPVRENGRGG